MYLFNRNNLINELVVYCMHPTDVILCGYRISYIHNHNEILDFIELTEPYAGFCNEYGGLIYKLPLCTPYPIQEGRYRLLDTYIPKHKSGHKFIMSYN